MLTNGFRVDPALLLPAQTVLHWCKEAWALKKGDNETHCIAVRQTWEAYRASQSRGQLPLHRVRGPVGNLIRTILALGWQPLEPWRWATAEGDILDILSSSPYLVRSRVEQAALAEHSPHGVTHWALCRELLADRSATARLLGASRDETHPIAFLSREQRGAAKAALEGKTWPAARKATLNIGSGYCPHCGHHWEDEQHRLWHCPAFQHIREQHGMTVDRFRALELWDHEDFRARLRPPLRWFKVDSVETSRIWGEPADWWTQGHTLTGVVCSDGSLLDPGPCARAAWGIKQVGLQGFELAGTLAGPQTVPRAELTAVCVAAELATPPLVVVVDHFNLAAHWADAQGRLDDCLTSPLVDLWERLQTAIAEWPQGSFAIRWIP